MKYCANKYCTNEVKRPGRYCKKCESRNFRQNNILKYVYDTIKHNAKRRGYEFTISIEYFSRICEQSGYLERRGMNSDSLTLDRIIPSLGYIEGNIQVLTRAENVRKQNREKGWNVKPVDRTGVPF